MAKHSYYICLCDLKMIGIFTKKSIVKEKIKEYTFNYLVRNSRFSSDIKSFEKKYGSTIDSLLEGGSDLIDELVVCVLYTNSGNFTTDEGFLKVKIDEVYDIKNDFPDTPPLENDEKVKKAKGKRSPVNLTPKKSLPPGTKKEEKKGKISITGSDQGKVKKYTINFRINGKGVEVSRERNKNKALNVSDENKILPEIFEDESFLKAYLKEKISL